MQKENAVWRILHFFCFVFVFFCFFLHEGDKSYYRLRTVPTNSKVFLRGLLNMREKQISASVIKIPKENWRYPRIFQR